MSYGNGSADPAWVLVEDECPGKRRKIGVPKCGCPNLLGPELEGRVWTEVADFLGNPDIFQAEMDRRVHGQEGQGAEAERKIADLNRRLANVDHRETELVALRLRDAVSEVALDRIPSWYGSSGLT